MRSYYIDTSALLKRYFVETGSSAIKNLFQKKAVFFTASLSYVEFYSTLSRLRRQGGLTQKESAQQTQFFEQDWTMLAIVDLSPDVRKEVPLLTEKIALRGADLVHLASAQLLHKRNLTITFVASDRKLLNAANEVGLESFDPTAVKE